MARQYKTKTNRGSASLDDLKRGLWPEERENDTEEVCQQQRKGEVHRTGYARRAKAHQIFDRNTEFEFSSHIKKLADRFHGPSLIPLGTATSCPDFDPIGVLPAQVC